jgi:hypothetical protein
MFLTDLNVRSERDRLLWATAITILWIKFRWSQTESMISDRNWIGQLGRIACSAFARWQSRAGREFLFCLSLMRGSADATIILLYLVKCQFPCELSVRGTVKMWKSTHFGAGARCPGVGCISTSKDAATFETESSRWRTLESSIERY